MEYGRDRHLGPTNDVYPLTPMQLGLLAESNGEGRPWVNVEQLVCHLDDEVIDPLRLERAWTHVQHRHAMLRTRLEWDDVDEPVHVVHEAMPLAVEVRDRTTLDPAARADDLTTWLAEDRDRGVDVAAAPAMRLTLHVDGPTSGVLVWTFHHAMLDGRSFTLVLAELLDAYTSLVAGHDPDDGSDASAGRFADHVVAVSRIDRAGAEHWFRDLLSGYDTPLDLATAIPEAVPAAGTARTTSGRHRVAECRVPASVVASLREGLARTGATVSSSVLTAWGIALGRYAGRNDAVFGCTRSGRPSGNDIAGCLITTVPVRVRTEPDSTVDDLLADVRAQQIGVRPHEHASPVDIDRWTELPRGVSLYDTAVVFERHLVDELLRSRGGAWAQRRIEVLEEAGLPMLLAAYEHDGLDLQLEYDDSRFDGAASERLVQHVGQLLRSIATSGPTTTVSDLRMLQPDERAELLSWSGQPSPARGPWVIEQFERRVDADPDRSALSTADRREAISYAELDARVNRLANHLIQVGVTAGSIVAITLPRCPDFVVSLLAVLKVGAAYLPVDPTYPAEVIDHMLVDSAAPVIIADRPLHVGDRTVVRTDADADTIARASPDRPVGRSRSADDLAYVIYTSGSTGAPKGVLISHGALAGFAAAVTELYQLSTADRVLQFASLSFDVSVEEVVPTLLAGAELVLRSDAMAESFDELIAVTAARGLTVLNLPSAFWHGLVGHLADAVEADAVAPSSSAPMLPPSVRLVVVGGEKVARRSYEWWGRHVPGVRWINAYGPTEATVSCVAYEASERYRLGTGKEIPIGRPLANASAYILGPDRGLVPVGVAGELWIGGSGVALGYLGRDELTAERFVKDPFSAYDGARMYRTGDLARWLPSGDIEYLGRIDRQLKVRGFRIEPGEVESVLERHPHVAQAFVSTDPAGTRLVAWVTPARTDGAAVAVDPAGVVTFAATVLPSQMVPAVVVPVAELVLTPGGKVDTAALPIPAASRSGQPAGDAPAGPLAHRLATLFGDVLGVPDVGVDDSFFELGGHSLVAIRLISRIRRDCGERVSLGILHDAPTPRFLADRLGHAPPVDPSSYVIPIQPKGTRPPLFGVHVLGINGAFYRPLADQLGLDQPVFGVGFAATDVTTPTAVDEIAERYAAAITRSHPDGPLALAAVSLGGFVAFELAQQLTAAGRDVRLVAMFDGAGPAGRPMVRGAARARRHVAHMTAGGPAYAARKTIARLAGLAREGLEAARLRVRTALGRPLTDELQRAAFVVANVAAADAYVARPYQGRLLVLRAADESFDAPEAIHSALGWAPVAAGGLEVIDVPGTHMSMLELPHVVTLAAALDDALERAGR